MNSSPEVGAVEGIRQNLSQGMAPIADFLDLNDLVIREYVTAASPERNLGRSADALGLVISVRLFALHW
ncbi:hypothetical protein DS837_28025 [Azospirillum brasilense]|uniref:Uncharacterized protein n=1 Tax=Azospirillum brasilense TaxID=192 RepID=A0A6L3AS81_AZOBR|nr:hypothetical protein DS837_28025 [Azospirillum brasilense]